MCVGIHFAAGTNKGLSYFVLYINTVLMVVTGYRCRCLPHFQSSEFTYIPPETQAKQKKPRMDFSHFFGIH